MCQEGDPLPCSAQEHALSLPDLPHTLLLALCQLLVEGRGGVARDVVSLALASRSLLQAVAADDDLWLPQCKRLGWRWAPPRALHSALLFAPRKSAQTNAARICLALPRLPTPPARRPRPQPGLAGPLPAAPNQLGLFFGAHALPLGPAAAAAAAE